jgi:hypothetical protein
MRARHHGLEVTKVVAGGILAGGVLGVVFLSPLIEIFSSIPGKILAGLCFGGFLGALLSWLIVWYSQKVDKDIEEDALWQKNFNKFYEEISAKGVSGDEAHEQATREADWLRRRR